MWLALVFLFWNIPHGSPHAGMRTKQQPRTSEIHEDNHFAASEHENCWFPYECKRVWSGPNLKITISQTCFFTRVWLHDSDTMCFQMDLLKRTHSKTLGVPFSFRRCWWSTACCSCFFPQARCCRRWWKICQRMRLACNMIWLLLKTRTVGDTHLKCNVQLLSCPDILLWVNCKKGV